MEADIVLEGFNTCEAKYGLRYMKIIADGDSSTLARLQQSGPVWCKQLQKVECANHSLKCLRGHLEKLVEDKTQYKGKDKLSKPTRERLCRYIRYAVRLRSLEDDRTSATKHLKEDILHSLDHAFGVHVRCHPDVCLVKKGETGVQEGSRNEEPQRSHQPSGDVLATVDQTAAAWKEATVEDGLEVTLARGGRPGGAIDVAREMRHDVMFLLNRLGAKADRLIGNFTTNLAENWMSLRSKFDGGKFVNRCHRGSWQARCHGAVLRKNLGPDWSAKVWEEVTCSPATSIFHVFGQHVAEANKAHAKCRSQPAVRKRRWQRKQARAKVNSSLKAQRSYGQGAEKDTPDVSTEQLAHDCQVYYSSHVCVTRAESDDIERTTRPQSLCDRWREERAKRLTASNFGIIISKKPTTKLAPTIERLLYSKFQGTADTRFGKEQERSTLQEYELQTANQGKVVVEPCGLMVNPLFPFLGASPDGIVFVNGEPRGLIEVKNVLKDKPITLEEAAVRSSFCLKLVNGSLQARASHPYYHQCMGQLHISEMPWLDFVVRTLNPYQLSIHRLTPDPALWETTMLPKLRRFYFQALLPELAAPRYGTVSGIREPGVSWNDAPQSDSDEPSPISNHDVEVRQLRPRRKEPLVTFAGRRIRHEWVVDEESSSTAWYEGTVVRVLSGQDGEPGTEYEVSYDGEDDLHIVDHLLQDYLENSLIFL